MNREFFYKLSTVSPLSRIVGRQSLVCCLFLIASFSPGNIAAQETSLTIKDFSFALHQLGKLEAFQYSSETKAFFPDGKKETLHTLIAVDKRNRLAFYKTDLQLLIYNKNWTYGVNFKDKEVSVFNNEKYSQYRKVIPDPKQYFDQSPLMELLDAAILKAGTLTEASRKGNLATFKMSFPEGAYIQSIILVYDYSSGLPHSFFVRYIRDNGGVSGKSGERYTIFETLSKNYSGQPDSALFNTSPYFRRQGSKVFLLKYKNYKLTSIL